MRCLALRDGTCVLLTLDTLLFPGQFRLLLFLAQCTGLGVMINDRVTNPRHSLFRPLPGLFRPCRLDTRGVVLALTLLSFPFALGAVHIPIWTLVVVGFLDSVSVERIVGRVSDCVL